MMNKRILSQNLGKLSQNGKEPKVKARLFVLTY